MNVDEVYKGLLVPNDSKLALVVLDGLGDIATDATGFRTPLEAAHTPTLDTLAKRSAMGRMIPVALGIDLKAGDVAARANFCSLDANGIVTDRRAGRIDTPVCEAQVEMLKKK